MDYLTLKKNMDSVYNKFNSLKENCTFRERLKLKKGFSDGIRESYKMLNEGMDLDIDTPKEVKKRDEYYHIGKNMAKKAWSNIAECSEADILKYMEMFK